MIGIAALFIAAAIQNIDGPKQWREADRLFTAGDVTNCPYRVVAELDTPVHKNTMFGKRPSDEKVVREMAEDLAKQKVEFDAVVNVRLTELHARGIWGSVRTGTGQAVKFVGKCESPALSAGAQ